MPFNHGKYECRKIYKHDRSCIQKKGGIHGQRAPLKTKTAQTIRKRMVNDIAEGAILPPIVVGAITDDATYEKLKNAEIDITKDDICSFSIIDGMQRTTALQDALKNNHNISNKSIRIEYWVSTSMNSLIYRMLVLNTGQVPWDIKRQLDTIYDPIVREIERKIENIDIRLIDETGRRSTAGQYQSSKLIEYFLCFSTRKVDVELKDKVSEDFARMDAITSVSNNESLQNFISVIEQMVNFDSLIGNLKDISDNGKFKSGKDLFTSIPAGAGFVSAASVFIYGPPGLDYSPEEIHENSLKFKEIMTSFLEKLSSLSQQKQADFLEFQLLNEKLSARSSKVGTFERDFFFKSFEALFNFSERLPSMQACWSAR
ncbi:hypothetical protein [Vibrio cholerae]|uniref:hypothetical protein n=1 Tax=Vibrio cholerae TaxID=666 RepID=UPI001965E13E|nr:hypothetical protein [Vibrio cholerae]HBC3563218.1 hypothetical protein [Vibrio cholerae]